MVPPTTKAKSAFLTALLVLSVVAGTVALTGSTVADHGDVRTDAADAPVDTGSAHWKGQRLWMANLDPNKTYVLQRIDNLPSDVLQFRTDHDGQAVLGTSNLTAGNRYAVYDPETDDYVRFEEGEAVNQTASPDEADWSVETQTLNVTASPTEVNNDGDETTTTVTVDSNREGGFGAVVTASELSDRQLVEVFDLAQDDYEGDGIRIPTSQGRQHTLDFSGVPGGNYTLDWTVRDTGASASVSVDVTEVENADANFANATFREHRGDVVEFGLELRNATSADVTLGGESAGYRADLNVTDGDGDGTVTVRFNTYRPGSATSFSAVADADQVNVTNSLSGDGSALAAGEYDLSSSIGGVEKDVAKLNLTERATENVTTYTMPGDAFGSSETAAAFEELRANGELTRTEEVADRDVVVWEINASGIYGAFEAAEGDSPEERLIGLTNDPGDPLNLTVVQTDSGNKRLDLGETHRNTDARALNVVPVPEEDTLYVSIKTDRAVFEQPGDESGGPPEPGDTFETTFGANAGGPLLEDGGHDLVSADWTLVERSATFHVKRTANGTTAVFVPASASATVTGSTTVAPGTDVSVKARADEGSPFIKTADATVAPNGSFAATFDLSNASEGQEFTLTIPEQGFEDDAETAARVGTGPHASVTIENQTTNGSFVTVASVNLSAGGFVAVHDASLLEGQVLESVRGTSGYLKPGSQSNVRVTLDAPLNGTQTVVAVAHLDTNGNKLYDFVSTERDADGPYLAGGESVRDDASVTVQNETAATPTPNATATPTATATATATETATATPTTTGTETGGQPGFGPAVSVLALLAAALLALRRD